ncbi:hypothetical protein E2C01_012488 [Portunus trituberculatus]|uniref:Uncharacterized protein n=1 Tax=Portunus trituberculatus TaxID=210409 RepID=A0A5B7DE03_PORTR|nr:hypothetical protein [Portunus trituberculatus]
MIVHFHLCKATNENETRIIARVHPEVVPLTHSLGAGCIRYNSAFLGTYMFTEVVQYNRVCITDSSSSINRNTTTSLLRDQLDIVKCDTVGLRYL